MGVARSVVTLDTDEADSAAVSEAGCNGPRMGVSRTLLRSEHWDEGLRMDKFAQFYEVRDRALFDWMALTTETSGLEWDRAAGEDVE